MGSVHPTLYRMGAPGWVRPRWNQGRGLGERLAGGDQGPELQALVLVNKQPPPAPTSYSA